MVKYLLIRQPHFLSKHDVLHVVGHLGAMKKKKSKLLMTSRNFYSREE